MDFQEKKQETTRLLRQWQETGMLEGITNENQQRQMAVMLESQRLMVEQNPKHKGTLELAQQVFKDLLAFKMVSIQSMMGPVDKIQFLRFRYSAPKLSYEEEIEPGDAEVTVYSADDAPKNKDLPEINLVLEEEEVVAKTRILKTLVPMGEDGFVKTEEIPAVAKSIREEITREIWTDLRNNAGTVATWDFRTALGDTMKERYESIYIKIVEISSVIHRKTLRGGANWIVMNPKIAKIFTAACGFFSPPESSPAGEQDDIRYIGTINCRWRLYVDPKYPVDDLLIGYAGESPMDAGYFYCPYIPLTYIEGPPSEESGGIPEGRVIARYSKKLLREGAKFYAKLTIQNFDI